MAWLQENGLSLLMFALLILFMLRGHVLARLTGVEQLTVHELSQLLASASPPLLLDVRTQAEYSSGHIQGSHILPVSELRRRVEEVRQKSSSRPVAVICLSGNRSVMGAVTLKRAKFDTVFNVVGGMASWKAQGYPMSS